MVVTCDIEFDSNQLGTFSAGQLISGCVILKSDKSEDVRAMVLKIFGYSLTKWTERNFSQKKLYVGRDDYINTVTNLIGSEEANNNHTMPAGVHTYDFACQLPQQCPSSFEGTHGCIRYLIKVILSQFGRVDQIYTRGFTVLKALNLNSEALKLSLQANTEAYRTFCCGPCKTPPLKIELYLPQKGYVPGQRIPITAVFINNANVTVSTVTASLIMLVRYFSQLPKNARVERVLVTKAKGDSVLRHSTRALTIDLIVPATPPTSSNSNSILQIAYQLEVEARVKSVRESQIIAMPIIIGTIPLIQNSVVVQQPSLKSDNSELPIVASIANSLPGVAAINLQEIPAPAYSEAKHAARGNINEDEQHASSPNVFAPLYPVYSLTGPDSVVAPNNLNIGYVNQSFVK